MTIDIEAEDEDIERARQFAAEYQEVLGLMAAKKYRKVLNDSGITPVVTIYDEFTVDSYGTMRIGEWGGWYIDIMLNMIFNERLVLTPKNLEGVWDFGWCYPRARGLALIAVLAWNPETEGAPAGAIKYVGTRDRRAGETASNHGIF